MEAVGRAAPGFAHGGRGSVLSFLSEKERKNQRKETLTGWNLRGNHRVSRTRLCARRKGERSFFSFRKRAKEPEKRNLNGVEFARKPSGEPHPALRAPEGGRSFFSFGKGAKEPKKRNLNGGDAWKPSGGPSPALRAPEGGVVLSFLSEKERKNQRAETLTGGMHGSHRAGRPRLCARRKGAAFFLFFQKKSERTREKKP